jgi:hypothetical protein
VPRVLELVVKRSTVVDHGAAVVEPENGLGHGTAAGRVDDIRCGLRSHQRVQPGGVSTHPPSRLVGHDPLGLAHRLSGGLVHRSQREAARSTVCTLPPRLSRMPKRFSGHCVTQSERGACDRPRFTAGNIHYEIAYRTRGLAHGGIGASHRLARQLGLIDAIDARLHLLKIHLPLHESDQVRNFAYHVRWQGTGLQDIELRRHD